MQLLSFLEDLDLAHRTRGAREWLAADDRRRVVALVVASVAMSLLMSLLATALVGFVERRRAAGEPAPDALPGDAVQAGAAADGEPEAAAATPDVEAAEPPPA